MDIGIIGSGTVAQTLAAKLLELGHSVMISSRDTSLAKDLGARGAVPSAADFAAAQRALGREAAAGGFADAAAHGEVVINATAGGHSLEALEAAGAANLAGKILVDVANPLDFSQRHAADAPLLQHRLAGGADPGRLPGGPRGEDAQHGHGRGDGRPGAAERAHDDLRRRQRPGGQGLGRTELLERWFGWRQVLDLGDVTAARGLEMWLPLWLSLMSATGTPVFNLRIVTARAGTGAPCHIAPSGYKPDNRRPEGDRVTKVTDAPRPRRRGARGVHPPPAQGRAAPAHRGHARARAAAGARPAQRRRRCRAPRPRSAARSTASTTSSTSWTSTTRAWRCWSPSRTSTT